MDRQEQLLLLLRARNSPRGILIKSNDPKALRTLLYAARREGGFFDLSFRLIDTPEANMQICHTSALPNGVPNASKA